MWQLLTEEVRKQQTFFDKKIQAWSGEYAARGGRLYCARGCRNCCTLAVNCSFGEAKLVADSLSPDQASALACHADFLIAETRKVEDLKSFLRMHRDMIGPCPFLEQDGACGVYPVRPFSCRALLATRPSDWCGVDFGTLPPIERQVFMSGLDQSVVSYPTHYVAATQDLGQELEAQALWSMRDQFGLSLSGNLPFLVFLEREHRLSEVVSQGAEAVVRLLEKNNLHLPFLISVSA